MCLCGVLCGRGVVCLWGGCGEVCWGQVVEVLLFGVGVVGGDGVGRGVCVGGGVGGCVCVCVCVCV